MLKKEGAGLILRILLLYMFLPGIGLKGSFLFSGTCNFAQIYI